MNIECFRFRKFSLLNFTFFHLQYAGIKQMFVLCIFYTMADDAVVVVVAFSFNSDDAYLKWICSTDEISFVGFHFLQNSVSISNVSCTLYTLLTYQSMETGPEFIIIMYTTTTILMCTLQSKISWFGSFLYMSKCKIFKHFKIKHYQTVLGSRYNPFGVHCGYTLKNEIIHYLFGLFNQNGWIRIARLPHRT